MNFKTKNCARTRASFFCLAFKVHGSRLERFFRSSDWAGGPLSTFRFGFPVGASGPEGPLPDGLGRTPCRFVFWPLAFRPGRCGADFWRWGCLGFPRSAQGFPFADFPSRPLPLSRLSNPGFRPVPCCSWLAPFASPSVFPLFRPRFPPPWRATGPLVGEPTLANPKWLCKWFFFLRF